MSEATSIATIFEDFCIDHTPDGWPPVKQMHLTAAAAELRRLQTSEAELLAALKHIEGVAMAEEWRDLPEIAKHARAAIAKAEGAA